MEQENLPSCRMFDCVIIFYKDLLIWERESTSGEGAEGEGENLRPTPAEQGALLGSQSQDP